MLPSSWQFVLWWWLFPPWHLVSWTPLLEQFRGDIQCWESWVFWYRILVNFCHSSDSETHRGRSQDWQAGPVSTLVLCGRGGVCSDGQIAVCWCEAMLLLGKHTGSAVRGLCWKSSVSSASLPPLSSLENWLPLGACLQLWRLLRAGAPFQITGFFVCFVGFCFGFLGSVWLFYISPVSIALVMFGPTLTRSFQSWAYPMYEFSLWAGSDITAWEKRTSQPVIWDTGRATFSILDSPC